MARGFTGLVAPPFTPMHPDGSVNLDIIETQAEALIADGVSAAFVCGSSGESLLLSVPERLQIAERWRQAVGDRLPLIVHAGHECLGECKTLAAHAQSIGASAIAAMPPVFFKPPTLEALVARSAEIAAAAPELPFYYYHIPDATGVRFAMVDYLTLASERIPTLAGMKFTFEDFMDLRLCLSLEDGRFNILFGREEMLLAGLATGVQGSVSTGYNFSAPLYLRIFRAFEAGDIAAAQAEQARAAELVAMLKRMRAPWKAIMKMIGIDCGPYRPPLHTATPEEYDALEAALDHFGFFDDCAGGGRR